MTIDEAFRQGITLLKRKEWIHGDYMEVVQSPLDGRYYTPIAKLHTPYLNEINDVPIWQVEQDGWEPYHLGERPKGFEG